MDIAMAGFDGYLIDYLAESIKWVVGTWFNVAFIWNWEPG